jgi:hypothetical protein
LRDANDEDGRLKRFLGFSVVASAAVSVGAAALGFKLKRLRPAVKPPRPLGASVVVVGASVVVVVVGASVVVVVVVEGATLDVASSSTVVASSSLDTVVASTSDLDFLSSSLAFSLARMAYKSMASFSIKGVVSSSSSAEVSVVLDEYSTDDFDTVSTASDFDSSVSMILGPFELFSSVTKL